MPSVSRSQQKLFGMVHAIQTGRLDPSKVSSSARRLAQKMSHSDVKKYATTHLDSLPDKIKEILTSEGGYLPVTDTPPASPDQPYISNDPHLVEFDEDYNEKQNKILSIVKDRKPAEVDGTMVDLYTAALLSKVLKSLSNPNKEKMLSLKMEHMVATAYKLVTR